MIADIVTISELLIQRSQMRRHRGCALHSRTLGPMYTTAANARFTTPASCGNTTLFGRFDPRHDRDSKGFTYDPFRAEQKNSSSRLSGNYSPCSISRTPPRRKVARHACQRILRRYGPCRPRGGQARRTTGLIDLDKLIRSRPGEIIVVAARPSCGKSALAAHFAAKAAEDGVPAYFASGWSKRQRN